MAWMQTNNETLYLGDSLAVLKTLPDCSVQCCVTSPPYWALRDYGVEGQLGLEATPEEFVDNMVAMFREVRRVLRNDGTLWLNIGDSYSAKPTRPEFDFKDGRSNRGYRRSGGVPKGLKPKDMVGIPWMLAFALRADGWYLRQDIIWFKRSPMPESVRDRCTKAHEYIFLLTKSQKYFYDRFGSQEETTGNAHSKGNNQRDKLSETGKGVSNNASFNKAIPDNVLKRNMRSVWPLSAYPLKAAHFAAYPPELVRRCLSAGVSEKGCCPTCRKPWIRLTESKRFATRPGTGAKQHVCSNWQTGQGSHDTLKHNTTEGEHPKNWKADNFDSIGQRGDKSPNRDSQRHVTEVVTVGWKPGCKCEPIDPVPCVVLDPFHGAGTTWKVCQRLGLKYVGIELNEEYLKLSVDRPAVHFPHEKRKSVKRVKKTSKQLELFQ